MASSVLKDLFQGAPQSSSSSSTQTTELPSWMQDYIYQAANVNQGLATKPYESYDLPTVAELSPLQQQAYTQVQENQGAWAPEMTAASQGMQQLAGATTAGQLDTAQQKYLRPEMVDQNLQAGQGYWNRAGAMDMVGAAKPLMDRAARMSPTGAASPLLQRAGAMDITGAANPYLNKAGAATQQAATGKAMTAANPYLQAAAKSSVADIGRYMNPYQQNVMDVIAKQGARNLSENLLPAVSDAFIRAGQFGGSRMGEFGSRALRDTQEAILNEQARAAEQGYGQAMTAAQGDLSRQAGLAATAGNISGADLSRLLSAGSQYGNLGQTAGQLTGQQMQNLTNIGQISGNLAGTEMSNLANIGQSMGQLTGQQMQNLANLGQLQTSAGQFQQTTGLNAAQSLQAAQAGDISRQQGALNSLAAIAQQEQALRSSDTAALEAAGAAMQNQAQKELTSAQQQWQAEQNYPQLQFTNYLNNLSAIRNAVPVSNQVVGSSTGNTYSPSPAAQIGSAVTTLAGVNAIANPSTPVR